METRIPDEETGPMEDVARPLSAVASGAEVTLDSITGGRGTRLKLVGIGLGVGMRIKVLSSGGSGPCVIVTGNRRLALGRGIAKKIMVRKVMAP